MAARKKTQRERRTYPWRAALTDVACNGERRWRRSETSDPHLPVLYSELVQLDPLAHPFEWTCQRCDTTAPSMWWDQEVPVPPHEFVYAGDAPVNHVALIWQCRVCLQASDNRMFHPAPANLPFDPTRIDESSMVQESGAWAVYVDESLGAMEAYVDGHTKVVVFNSETWQIVDGDDEASALIFGLTSGWRDGASGMRYLSGIPVFDGALRKFRAGRGDDVVMAKDEITQLAELLSSLATQAVSLANETDEDQRRILTRRYLEAKQRLEVLQKRMDGLYGQLDTVAMGVMVFG